MNKTNFTPGPWKAHKANWHTWLVLKEGFQVAVVEMSEDTPENEIDEQTERVIADSNLISAAPEMYEALEAIEEYFQAVKTPNIYDDPGTMKSLLFETARKNVGEAMKKARNER